MINSVNAYHVHELLSPDNPVKYHVPAYQREYSWSKSQWEELFEDLSESEGEHFLGTIICINQTRDAMDGSALEIIDGQQRLTTLSLLLAAIYHELADNRDLLDDDQTFDMLNLRKSLVLGGRDGQPRVRPQRQNHNLDDYHFTLKEAGLPVASSGGWYVGVRRIKKCYEFFRAQLSNAGGLSGTALVERCIEMLDKTKRSLLVKLEVQNQADAYSLFESLNNRGMPLTPIDLIKNSLLAQAEKTKSVSVDDTFEAWNVLLVDLGGDPTHQERFFRQYYNAFKSDLVLVRRATLATKSNMIRIYETQINDGVEPFLEKILPAARLYRRIIGRLPEEVERTAFDHALTRLRRAQGAPSFLLLLFLMTHWDRLSLTEAHLTRITELLGNFIVRRNLTGTPATYSLPSLFMALCSTLDGDMSGDEVVERVLQELRDASASDEEFAAKLAGPIYQDNVDATRFILASLAEENFTKETAQDLWARVKNRFIWTIEHILPQGEHLPEGWVDMLGGPGKAAEVQERLVHTVGNLTLTGYNSTLGNKTFEEKRDRADQNGNLIGFRNRFSLNDDVVSATRWDEEHIQRRGERLINQILKTFPLSISGP